MSFVALILGAVGAVLSVFKKRWCFAVWLPANLYWVWFNWPGIQSVVFAVMTISCFIGWILWGDNTAYVKHLRTENQIFKQGWTAAQKTNIELKEENEGLKGHLDHRQ